MVGLISGTGWCDCIVHRYILTLAVGGLGWVVWNCRSVHVGILALVDWPGLRGIVFGVDRDVLNGNVFMDGCI
jgi:hypothetical protein